MTRNLIKIDDNTVALITERRVIMGKTAMVERKNSLEEQLVEVNEMLALLP